MLDDPDDLASAGRWWEAAGDRERARHYYGRALGWLEGGPHWGWVASRSAMLSKRAGARDDAVGLWLRLFDDGDDAAGLELAMHYEHRARDLSAAEEVTRALLVRADATLRIRLEERLARILRKRHKQRT